MRVLSPPIGRVVVLLLWLFIIIIIRFYVSQSALTVRHDDNNVYGYYFICFVFSFGFLFFFDFSVFLIVSRLFASDIIIFCSIIISHTHDCERFCFVDFCEFIYFFSFSGIRIFSISIDGHLKYRLHGQHAHIAYMG